MGPPAAAGPPPGPGPGPGVRRPLRHSLSTVRAQAEPSEPRPPQARASDSVSRADMARTQAAGCELPARLRADEPGAAGGPPEPEMPWFY